MGVRAASGVLVLLTLKEIIMQLIQRFKQFIRDEEGVTAIEYGILAALIIVVCVVAITLVGTNLNVIFSSIAAKL